MSFDPKQLRGFVAVADAGSIGMAARAINISQPALSRIIRSLEECHGVRLFERTTTGMTLTHAGEVLLPHARMLLFELECAAEELMAFRGLRKGKVRIGAVSAVVRTILAPAVAKLMETAPHLQIEIVESHDDLLFSALVGNQVDLVLAVNTHQSDQIVSLAECRFEDSYNLFCRAGHPLLQKAPRIEDLFPGRWVLPPPHSTPRKLFEEIVRRHGCPPPNVVIETISTNAMIASVAHSDVLGWLPDPVFQSAQLAGFVDRIDMPEFKLGRHIFLFKRAKGLLTPAARAFVDSLPIKARL